MDLEKLIEHEVRYYGFAAVCVRTPYAWFLRCADLPSCREVNRALRLRDDGRGAVEVAQTVVADFRAHGLPVTVEIDAESEAQGIGAALRQLGVMPVLGHRVCMTYPQTDPPAPAASEVKVLAAPHDEDSVLWRVWIATNLHDVESYEDAAMWRELTVREARYLLCRLYLGFWEDQAAGTCDLFSDAGWGRVEMVETRREFRRRGVASVLVGQAVADSLAAGNAVTYLLTEAGSDAERLYRRLGFVSEGVDLLRRHLGA